MSETIQSEHIEQTPQQLEEARQYDRAQLKLTLIDKAVDFLFLGVAAFVVAKPLGDWVARQPWAINAFIQAAAIAGLIFAAHVVVSLPLSFYGGFILEHKFHLSKQSFGGWLWKKIKLWILAGAMECALMSGLFILITSVGEAGGMIWIALSILVFFVLNVVLGMLLPVLILPMFYKIERLDNESLLDGLRRLTEPTSLTLEGVYKMNMSDETVKANAMLAGLGKTRRVILGDTLLDSFQQDEIETVFAHEIGHHVHGHLWKMIPLSLVFSAFAFYLCDLFIRFLGVQSMGMETFSYSALQPWVIVPIEFFFMAIFSLYEPLSNAISRHFERQADAYALEHCGADAYIRTFTRLATLNKSDPNPPRWAVIWFDSHPPIGERIAMAKGGSRE